ncbi:alkaline shock response membrane anchor protein AmaP [Kitasatospora sp. NPDC017646]|uniref:alkaline shock response membrane anchor protein AmaP n=1 Tax=Kitasatospora sp. NPDC017646 TaxID=3364024 RepID=UPI00379B087C
MKALTATNRTLLALTGLILLAGGLLTLMGGLDLYRRWHLTPPEYWPLTAPTDVLLPTTDRTRYTTDSWWWPTLITTLTIIALLALLWLLAQLRRHQPRTLTLDPASSHPPISLHTHALAQAVATDTARLPGIDQAHARITGTATRPELSLHLTLDPAAPPAATLQAVHDGPLTRLQTSLGGLPVRTHLRIAHHRTRHLD